MDSLEFRGYIPTVDSRVSRILLSKSAPANSTARQDPRFPCFEAACVEDFIVECTNETCELIVHWKEVEDLQGYLQWQRIDIPNVLRTNSRAFRLALADLQNSEDLPFRERSFVINIVENSNLVASRTFLLRLCPLRLAFYRLVTSWHEASDDDLRNLIAHQGSDGNEDQERILDIVSVPRCTEGLPLHLRWYPFAYEDVSQRVNTYLLDVLRFYAQQIAQYQREEVNFGSESSWSPTPGIKELAADLKTAFRVGSMEDLLNADDIAAFSYDLEVSGRWMRPFLVSRVPIVKSAGDHDRSTRVTNARALIKIARQYCGHYEGILRITLTEGGLAVFFVTEAMYLYFTGDCPSPSTRFAISRQADYQYEECVQDIWVELAHSVEDFDSWLCGPTATSNGTHNYQASSYLTSGSPAALFSAFMRDVLRKVIDSAGASPQRLAQFARNHVHGDGDRSQTGFNHVLWNKAAKAGCSADICLLVALADSLVGIQSLEPRLATMTQGLNHQRMNDIAHNRLRELSLLRQLAVNVNAEALEQIVQLPVQAVVQGFLRILSARNSFAPFSHGNLVPDKLSMFEDFAIFLRDHCFPVLPQGPGLRAEIRGYLNRLREAKRLVLSQFPVRGLLAQIPSRQVSVRGKRLTDAQLGLLRRCVQVAHGKWASHPAISAPYKISGPGLFGILVPSCTGSGKSFMIQKLASNWLRRGDNWSRSKRSNDVGDLDSEASHTDEFKTVAAESNGPGILIVVPGPHLVVAMRDAISLDSDTNTVPVTISTHQYNSNHILLTNGHTFVEIMTIDTVIADLSNNSSLTRSRDSPRWRLILVDEGHQVFSYRDAGSHSDLPGQHAIANVEQLHKFLLDHLGALVQRMVVFVDPTTTVDTSTSGTAKSVLPPYLLPIAMLESPPLARANKRSSPMASSLTFNLRNPKKIIERSIIFKPNWLREQEAFACKTIHETDLPVQYQLGVYRAKEDDGLDYYTDIDTDRFRDMDWHLQPGGTLSVVDRKLAEPVVLRELARGTVSALWHLRQGREGHFHDVAILLPGTACENEKERRSVLSEFRSNLYIMCGFQLLLLVPLSMLSQPATTINQHTGLGSIVPVYRIVEGINRVVGDYQVICTLPSGYAVVVTTSGPQLEDLVSVFEAMTSSPTDATVDSADRPCPCVYLLFKPHSLWIPDQVDKCTSTKIRHTVKHLHALGNSAVAMEFVNLETAATGNNSTRRSMYLRVNEILSGCNDEDYPKEYIIHLPPSARSKDIDLEGLHFAEYLLTLSAVQFDLSRRTLPPAESSLSPVITKHVDSASDFSELAAASDDHSVASNDSNGKISENRPTECGTSMRSQLDSSLTPVEIANSAICFPSQELANLVYYMNIKEVFFVFAASGLYYVAPKHPIHSNVARDKCLSFAKDLWADDFQQPIPYMKYIGWVENFIGLGKPVVFAVGLSYGNEVSRRMELLQAMSDPLAYLAVARSSCLINRVDRRGDFVSSLRGNVNYDQQSQSTAIELDHRLGLNNFSVRSGDDKVLRRESRYLAKIQKRVDTITRMAHPFPTLKSMLFEIPVFLKPLSEVRIEQLQSDDLIPNDDSTKEIEWYPWACNQRALLLHPDREIPLSQLLSSVDQFRGPSLQSGPRLDHYYRYLTYLAITDARTLPADGSGWQFVLEPLLETLVHLSFLYINCNQQRDLASQAAVDAAGGLDDSKSGEPLEASAPQTPARSNHDCYLDYDYVPYLPVRALQRMIVVNNASCIYFDGVVMKGSLSEVFQDIESLVHIPENPPSTSSASSAPTANVADSFSVPVANTEHCFQKLRILGFRQAIHLDGEFPSSLGLFSNLELIDLSRNNFHGTIPDCFRYLQSLHHLSLEHNSFRGSIPPTLRQLKRLHYLNIGSTSDLSLFRELRSESLSPLDSEDFKGLHYLDYTESPEMVAAWVSPSMTPSSYFTNIAKSLRVFRVHVRGEFLLSSLHVLKFMHSLERLAISCQTFCGWFPAFIATNENEPVSFATWWGRFQSIELIASSSGNAIDRTGSGSADWTLFDPFIRRCTNLQKLRLVNCAMVQLPNASFLNSLQKLVDLELTNTSFQDLNDASKYSHVAAGSSKSSTTGSHVPPVVDTEMTLVPRWMYQSNYITSVNGDMTIIERRFIENEELALKKLVVRINTHRKVSGVMVSWRLLGVCKDQETVLLHEISSYRLSTTAEFPMPFSTLSCIGVRLELSITTDSGVGSHAGEVVIPSAPSDLLQWQVYVEGPSSECIQQRFLKAKSKIIASWTQSQFYNDLVQGKKHYITTDSANVWTDGSEQESHLTELLPGVGTWGNKQLIALDTNVSRAAVWAIQPLDSERLSFGLAQLDAHSSGRFLHATQTRAINCRPTANGIAQSAIATASMYRFACLSNQQALSDVELNECTPLIVHTQQAINSVYGKKPAGTSIRSLSYRERQLQEDNFTESWLADSNSMVAVGYDVQSTLCIDSRIRDKDGRLLLLFGVDRNHQFARERNYIKTNWYLEPENNSDGTARGYRIFCLVDDLDVRHSQHQSTSRATPFLKTSPNYLPRSQSPNNHHSRQYRRDIGNSFQSQPAHSNRDYAHNRGSINESTEGVHQGNRQGRGPQPGRRGGARQQQYHENTTNSSSEHRQQPVHPHYAMYDTIPSTDLSDVNGKAPSQAQTTSLTREQQLQQQQQMQTAMYYNQAVHEMAMSSYNQTMASMMYGNLMTSQQQAWAAQGVGAYYPIPMMPSMLPMAPYQYYPTTGVGVNQQAIPQVPGLNNMYSTTTTAAAASAATTSADQQSQAPNNGLVAVGASTPDSYNDPSRISQPAVAATDRPTPVITRDYGLYMGATIEDQQVPSTGYLMSEGATSVSNGQPYANSGRPPRGGYPRASSAASPHLYHSTTGRSNNLDGIRSSSFYRTNSSSPRNQPRPKF